jgi:hypothetical protein
MRPSTRALLFVLTTTAAIACSSVPTNRLTDGAEQVDNPLDSPDDGPDSPPGPTPTTRPNPFGNAPPYKSDPPSEQAKNVHATNGVSVVPSLGVKCLGCHGTGAAPAFLFGGSIYSSRDATSPAADMELGIIDASGKTFFAHSDTDGNFWLKGSDSLQYPVYAAVRMNAMTKTMKTKVSDATKLECNSCHDKLNPIQQPQ